MARSIRVLVVDDFQPFRRLVASTLQRRPELQIIGEVSDGVEAVERLQDLQTDLVLLDIGLPSLNGIEAARLILERSPKTKILFVSAINSAAIVEEALRIGGRGYVLKLHAGRELLPAIDAVLRGEQFLSASLSSLRPNNPAGDRAAAPPHRDEVVTLIPRHILGSGPRHEVGWYSDDRWFLDDVTQFLGSSLNAGRAAIVVATESHREGLRLRLRASGADIDSAISQGRYIDVGAFETLSTFMIDDMPDPTRFLKAFGDLILEASKQATKNVHPRVAVFGEGAPLLLARGNTEAAIRIEELCNQLTHSYDADILCGYSLASVQSRMDSPAFRRICAEHSVVHSR